MSLYALMSFEQFASHRRKIRSVVKFSPCETEFYCRIKKEEDFEECTILDQNDLDQHLKSSPIWNPDAEQKDDFTEDLSGLKKSELVDIAEELGIDLPAKITKAGIIALIEEA